MSGQLFVQLLDLAAGTVLLCAVAVVWRRTVGALVRILAVQGAALGLLVAVLAAHRTDAALAGVALGVFALKGCVVPWLLGRAGADRSGGVETGGGPGVGTGGGLGVGTGGGLGVETESVVNVPASLLAAAGLTALAYAVCRPIVALTPTSPALQAAPIGVAVFLIGFFVLLTRRRAISQAVGFLLVDNGIATVAFLTVDGVPLVVELGASLDLVLAVLILQVLTTRIRRTFGDTDLDGLKELHD